MGGGDGRVVPSALLYGRFDELVQHIRSM
jgi:hypothetical protein